MRIGVRAHDYGKQSIEGMAALLRERGYTCAQLALPRAFREIDDYGDITLPLIDRIREAFADAGVQIAVFGCYMDLGNPDDEVRERAVKTFIRSLEWNRELGAEVVGTETAYPHLSREEGEIWKPYMMDSIQRIVEAAARLDVCAAIEPVYWHPLRDVETVQWVLDQIKDPRHLRVIFDASNLLEEPDFAGQGALWTRWLEVLGPYISALHIKDFSLDEQGRYLPQMLGEGVIDYTKIAQWAQHCDRDLPLLREEMVPERDQQDIAFIRRTFLTGEDSVRERD